MGVCVDGDSVFSGPQALGNYLVSVILLPVLWEHPYLNLTYFVSRHRERPDRYHLQSCCQDEAK